jgi:hypothetical protein
MDLRFSIKMMMVNKFQKIYRKDMVMMMDSKIMIWMMKRVD